MGEGAICIIAMNAAVKLQQLAANEGLPAASPHIARRRQTLQPPPVSFGATHRAGRGVGSDEVCTDVAVRLEVAPTSLGVSIRSAPLRLAFLLTPRPLPSQRHLARCVIESEGEDQRGEDEYKANGGDRGSGETSSSSSSSSGAPTQRRAYVDEVLGSLARRLCGLKACCHGEDGRTSACENA